METASAGAAAGEAAPARVIGASSSAAVLDAAAPTVESGEVLVDPLKEKALVSSETVVAVAAPSTTVGATPAATAAAPATLGMVTSPEASSELAGGAVMGEGLGPAKMSGVGFATAAPGGSPKKDDHASKKDDHHADLKKNAKKMVKLAYSQYKKHKKKKKKKKYGTSTYGSSMGTSSSYGGGSGHSGGGRRPSLRRRTLISGHEGDRFMQIYLTSASKRRNDSV